MKNRAILVSLAYVSTTMLSLAAAAPSASGTAGGEEPLEVGTSRHQALRVASHYFSPQARGRFEQASRAARDIVKETRQSPSIQEQETAFRKAILDRHIAIGAPMVLMQGFDKFAQMIYQSLHEKLRGRPGSLVTINLNDCWLDTLEPPLLLQLIQSINKIVRHYDGEIISLQLTNNNLQVLPEGIFTDLTNLRELWLQDNQLTTLPATIVAGLKKLRTLLLHNNQITTLPETVFADLVNLQNLLLNKNKLIVLDPGIFHGLTNLQLISLENNLLVELPHNIFAGLTNLQQLILRNNKLVTLQPDIFAGLARLQLLSLSNNQLTALPRGLFHGLTGLQQLWLGNNQISTVDRDTFDGAVHLKMLYLVNNPLTTLTADSLAKLPNLTIFALQGNNLPDADIKRLRAAFPEVSIK